MEDNQLKTEGENEMYEQYTKRQGEFQKTEHFYRGIAYWIISIILICVYIPGCKKYYLKRDQQRFIRAFLIEKSHKTIDERVKEIKLRRHTAPWQTEKNDSTVISKKINILKNHGKTTTRVSSYKLRPQH